MTQSESLLSITVQAEMSPPAETMPMWSFHFDPAADGRRVIVYIEGSDVVSVYQGHDLSYVDASEVQVDDDDIVLRFDEIGVVTIRQAPATVRVECHRELVRFWGPLRQVQRHLHGHLSSFMFMREATQVDGRVLYAYKHRDTRSYLILDEDGNAYGGLDASDHVEPVGLEYAIRVALGTMHPDSDGAPQPAWWPGVNTASS